MKINHIKKVPTTQRGIFSLSREWFKEFFSGDKLPDSQVSLDKAVSNRVSYHFHICLNKLTNNNISTFKIKVFQYSCNIDWRLGYTFHLKMKINDKNMLPSTQTGIFWLSRESYPRAFWNESWILNITKRIYFLGDKYRHTKKFHTIIFSTK